VIDDLAKHLPATTATWVLILTGVTGLAFALSAFAYDRLGYRIISAFLAAGAWLCAAFGALVWFWR
jgi:tellurite resistance protein TehA-like permease